MAERTFTEGEAYALVADAVERETASAKAETVKAQEQVTTLSNEKDALELRATAAEEAKAKAEQELTDFKTSVETQKAQEAKRAERVAKVTEVAPALKVEGERETRIVAMADDVFDEYIESLREVAADADGDDDDATKEKKAAAKKAAAAKAAGAPPRESAAFRGGDLGSKKTEKSPITGLFAARRAAMAPKS